MSLASEIAGVEVFAGALLAAGLYWLIPRFLATLNKNQEDDD